MSNVPALPESVDTLARTLYGEARGCGAAGMRHVASVVVNRAHKPGWWGSDVIGVCKAPYQFSCWNASDPNRPKLLAVTMADREFALAVSIAEEAIDGKLQDETGGSDSYYARTMLNPPAWAKTAHKTFSDGWHVFYRTAAPPVANVSVHRVITAALAKVPAEPSADDLNAAFLETLKDQA